MHHASENILPCQSPYAFLDKRGTYAAAHVVEKKPFCTQCAFEQSAEHEKGEHVEQYVGEILRGMHEHICEYLKHIEIGSPEIVQSSEIKHTVANAPTSTIIISQTTVFISIMFFVTGGMLSSALRKFPILLCRLNVCYCGNHALPVIGVSPWFSVVQI